MARTRILKAIKTIQSVNLKLNLSNLIEKYVVEVFDEEEEKKDIDEEEEESPEKLHTSKKENSQKIPEPPLIAAQPKPEEIQHKNDEVELKPDIIREPSEKAEEALIIGSPIETPLKDEKI